jgi:hypothetical protein
MSSKIRRPREHGDPVAVLTATDMLTRMYPAGASVTCRVTHDMPFSPYAAVAVAGLCGARVIPVVDPVALVLGVRVRMGSPAAQGRDDGVWGYAGPKELVSALAAALHGDSGALSVEMAVLGDGVEAMFVDEAEGLLESIVAE